MSETRVSVVIPVFNEEAALRGVVEELLPVLPPASEIVLVDDGSTDGSPALADQLADGDSRIRAVHHLGNHGYGRSLKTGADFARGALLVFMDSDGQHRPADLPRLLAVQADGDLDMVITRRLGTARASPLRAPAKWLLGKVANALTRTRIPDLNSGFRVVKAEFFQRVRPLLPDGFSLSTTLTVSGLKLGLSVAFPETEVRARTGRSTVRYFRDGYRTMLLVLRLVTLFDPLTFFVPLALLGFFSGLIYGTVQALVAGRGFPVLGVLFVLGGLFVFLLGIVCDQISSLRFEFLGLGRSRVPVREGR